VVRQSAKASAAAPLRIRGNMFDFTGWFNIISISLDLRFAQNHDTVSIFIPFR
jgi:hypothetical protein